MTQLGLPLDQPQTIEYDIFEPEDNAHNNGTRYRLANQDVVFDADADANLYDFFWPWADELYVRSIRMQVSAPREEQFLPMVTRIYPGYQETIYGSEGIIVGKQLVALLKSNYDRSALWLLECQAEGDRLLRVDVEIDWGEPLDQRMVDGLLVAQNNPGPARGLYSQKNADSTRVFGNPQGRPTEVNIDDPQRAHLVYYVLINGAVKVPLLLTVSDVGEQMAWNGFLSLREGDQEFDKSNARWQQQLRTGRLWTPDPSLNHAVHLGKRETAYRVQRMRTGVAPTQRHVHEVPALIDALDTFDVTASRNLLAQLRRVAERSSGRLPVRLPVHASEELIDPGIQLPWTNGAYIAALQAHLSHHPNTELLAEHYAAVGLCAEMLARLGDEYKALHDAGTSLSPEIGAAVAQTGFVLRRAVSLALQAGDHDNTVRWENVACDCEHLSIALQVEHPQDGSILPQWETETGWHAHEDGTWRFTTPMQGIALSGQAIWRGCGLSQNARGLTVRPSWPSEWSWWALLDLPLPTADPASERTISLVWDGTTLHSTQPVRSPLPVQLHAHIRTLHSDETDFDLQFEFVDENSTTEGPTEGPADAPQRFRPHFYPAPSAL